MWWPFATLCQPLRNRRSRISIGDVTSRPSRTTRIRGKTRGARPSGASSSMSDRRTPRGGSREESKKKTKFTRLPPWPLADAFATGYWGKDGRGETPLSILGARDGKQSFRITLYMRATLSAKVSPSPYCLLLANQTVSGLAWVFPARPFSAVCHAVSPLFRSPRLFLNWLTARRVSHLPHFSSSMASRNDATRSSGSCLPSETCSRCGMGCISCRASELFCSHWTATCIRINALHIVFVVGDGRDRSHVCG